MSGTGRACTTCELPNLAEVDRQLREGKTASAVARAFGLSRAAVANHRRKGHVLPEALVQTEQAFGPPPAAEPADPEDLEAQLRRHLAEVSAVDVSQLSPAQRMQVFEEKRRTIETLSKVAGPMDKRTVTLAEVDGLAEFLADMTVVLDRFPDARDALIPVVEKHFR